MAAPHSRDSRPAPSRAVRSAGVNPAFLVVGLLLILAWRNAGWYGLDRWLLPMLGTPWRRSHSEEREAERADHVEGTPLEAS